MLVTNFVQRLMASSKTPTQKHLHIKHLVHNTMDQYVLTL